MFLYEGDCLKNVTVIRGVRYVTVSHYSGDKEVCAGRYAHRCLSFMQSARGYECFFVRCGYSY